MTPYPFYWKKFHLPIDLEHQAYWEMKKLNLDLDLLVKCNYFSYMNLMNFNYILMRIFIFKRKRSKNNMTIKNNPTL